MGKGMVFKKAEMFISAARRFHYVYPEKLVDIIFVL